ncbi:MAG: nucleotidyltransferase family protein [bacterium]|nr:nucleotidyltransferase family protein [bacterium]
MTPEHPEALRVALEVIELLDRLGIPYHLGGSYASSVHGIPRQTQDIDLVVDLDTASVRELLSELPEGYYRDLESALDAMGNRKSFNLIHLASGVKIDVFVRGEEPFDREEFRRSRKVSLGSGSDRSVRVKSAEDTILRKLDWFRRGEETSDRQWSDVLGILESQESALDFGYLERWATELGVADLLERARADR